MQTDDQTGRYLAQRESAELTPAQRYRMEQTAEAPTTNEPENIDLAPDTTSSDFLGKVGDVASDVALGVVEAPRQVLGGVLEATEHMAKGLESVLPLGALDGSDEVEFLDIDEPRSATGGVIRNISQFLTGFLPASRALKAAGVTGAITNPASAGAFADMAVFDPVEERLSNLIQSVPELQNPITEFLAASPDDSEAEGRIKNALEGLGIGTFADLMFRGLRALRAARLAKNADEGATAAMGAVDDAGLPAVREGVEEADPEFIPFNDTMGNPDGKSFSMGAKKADKERALNINLSKIDTTEDVEKLIEGVAKADAKPINSARREVVTIEQTKHLADDLGMSVEDLLARRQGQAFNAEQALASRRILAASGEHLIELAKVASTGSEQQMAQFRRALAQHRAIQAQVSGMTAEAGRALNSFKILAESSDQQTRAISEALDAGGGMGFTKDLATKLSRLEPHQVNAFVKQSMGAKTKDAVYEAWINGLLSSPATHAVNVLGNSITTAWSVGERRVASWIGRGLGDQGVPDGEAVAALKGVIEGAKDGMKLAWEALKTGEPSDQLAKIESVNHRAISAENLDLSGPAGRFADFVGEVIRTPGRFLTAGDEFFKAVGYRMELNAQAFRQAAQEGLEGEELAARMVNIINNPPENLSMAAVDFSRYVTFTKPLGDMGQSVQSAANKIPGARIIVPFIRTPTNIMKFAGERTPLAPISKAVREEIAAGGARRDMALAKITTGSMVMAAAADYAMSGQITGHGPQNPDMRKLLMATGWQPYSIKVGDTYYSYNRLDPVGALIGISADIAEIMGQVGEQDATNLAASATIAVAQNITSKTYLSGLAEFFDVMSGTSADPEANNTRAVRWIERLAGSIVPAGVAQVERTLSPELSATQGIIEKLKSRIPGYSDDLPPRRNIFGEPVVLSGGLGPDIMSPIYTSTDKKDPIADEIVRQQAMVRMPRKTLDGVQLDTFQYDQYIRFYAGENNRFVDMPLKQKLAEVMRSPAYLNGTDGAEGSKSATIRLVFEAYRSAAKAAMYEEYPELQMNLEKVRADKAKMMLGR